MLYVSFVFYCPPPCLCKLTYSLARPGSGETVTYRKHLSSLRAVLRAGKSVSNAAFAAVSRVS